MNELLFQAIREHHQKGVLPFYTPGHKNGRAMDCAFLEFYSAYPLAFDLGFMGAFDDLHAPVGIIAEAEVAASRLYGAAHSFFLTNGTTGGIVALLLSMLRPGQHVILPRNVHRSVMTAMVLGDFIPEFVHTGFEPGSGLVLPLAAEMIPQASWDRASALLVTSPTYHGLATDIAQLARQAAARKVAFVVDEAHGAHLPFDSRLPKPALQTGAQAVVQSTHKTLQAITPGAMLHLSGNEPDPARLRQALRMTQTSSSNYAVLASLDASRHFMEGDGRQRLGVAIDAMGALYTKLCKLDLLHALDPHRPPPRGVSAIDPTKLVIDFGAVGLTGYEAAKLLLEEQRIGVELTTHTSVLLFVTAADTAVELEELGDRLIEFALQRSIRRSPITSEHIPPPNVAGEMAIAPRNAFFRPQVRIPFSQAIGRIAAEPIVPYPPGVPSIWPGERFCGDLQLFRAWIDSSKASVQASDSSLETVMVIE
ncbi:aminotransferase class I/II-fold pyridoxal phosphate-dependent enzyme [Notoacmeibacter marinus]|uniref:aminotransferase class I/II-fold pyridoxal phosphate-dependent enzyme n=1 Tax=Notoacmeibacter marinus TaxID=1876515 RepID=UPI000DF12AA8|nr:hypothetical protein [Notoacmeibacter marinus]